MQPVFLIDVIWLKKEQRNGSNTRQNEKNKVHRGDLKGYKRSIKNTYNSETEKNKNGIK